MNLLCLSCLLTFGLLIPFICPAVHATWMVFHAVTNGQRLWLAPNFHSQPLGRGLRDGTRTAPTTAAPPSRNSLSSCWAATVVDQRRNSTWTSSGIGVRALSSCTVQLKVLKNVPSSYGALRDQSFVSHASTIETRMLHPQHEVHVCVIMHIQTSIQTRASYLIPGPRKGNNKERVTEIVPH